MQTNESEAGKHRLDQILRKYHPGAEKLSRLRLAYGTDHAIAEQLENYLPQAQRTALAQVRKLRQIAIH